MPSWNELLIRVGQNVEEVGSTLRGKGQVKPKSLSIAELQDLRSALLENAKAIQHHIHHLKK